jgi:hypothetical protein
MQTKIPETISWKAPSHTHAKRSLLWYLGFAAIFLGLVAFAFYSKSILMGITFALMLLMLLFFSNQPSREITYHLTKTGIVIDRMTYPYKIIKKFWIIYHPPQIKTLNFEIAAYLNNRITLQLGKQDPMAVKAFLNQYLQEDLHMEESVTETLARRLKI